MIKLLYITNGINGSGGLERVLSIKASALADQQDYQVGILVLNDAHLNPFYKFSDKIQMMSVVAKGNPLRYFRQYRKGIKKAIAQFQPDVISVCDDGLKGLLFPILFGKKTPVIYERHVSQQVNLGKKQNALQTKFIKKLMLWAAKKFDTFVVLTKGNQEEWYGVKTKVIPNPLPFLPDKTATLENPKAIAVGKQSYQKGYERLIKSWAKIRNKHAGWQVAIFGKLDPNLQLEKQVENTGLHGVVHFYKPVKNIEKQYLEASFYVLPSRYEGFGMVLIEAMACGLPCIAFDVPHGPADIITDGLDGFLIPDGDVQAFADKIIFLIENPEIRQKMGAAARENVQRYLPENIISQWVQLFHKLLVT